MAAGNWIVVDSSTRLSPGGYSSLDLTSRRSMTFHEVFSVPSQFAPLVGNCSRLSKVIAY